MEDWERKMKRTFKLRKREQLERDLKAVNTEIEELEEEVKGRKNKNNTN